MPSRLTTAVLSFALAAPVALAATPAQAACATKRTVGGSIAGEDGRYVDALIGFDLLDAKGRALNGEGCVGAKGYGVTTRVNPNIPATGATTGGTKAWSVAVPTNAVAAYIETYPSGPRYAGTDESRYGHSMRRKIKLPYGTSITLRLPLVCEAGGKTGGINGYVSWRGSKVQADRVAAWSMAPDNNTAHPIMGWNVGKASPSGGYYKIDHLAAGQTYTVRITEQGVTKQFYNVSVRDCHNTYLSTAF